MDEPGTRQDGKPLARPGAAPGRRGLRALLEAPDVDFLMEAHDGLSARVVDGSRFDGVWASGLAISASLGLRDCNEASWTQVLAAVETIVDSTDLPVLVDADSGFGDFNNTRLFVRKLGERGASGACIEDKQFPKRNSFLGGDHELVSVGVMAGKLKAARDHAPTDDFCVLARTEALIAGYGVDEAVRRAHAYLAAGADAIVLHSKKATPSEVLEFARVWQHAGPLVLIPTTYFGITAGELEQAGASIVIWANHLARASMAAMRWVCEAMRRQGGPAQVEDRIATLDELFRLLEYPELAGAEERYRESRSRHLESVPRMPRPTPERAQGTVSRAARA
jgi:phosphoenolpyruvate phosphomutase